MAGLGGADHRTHPAEPSRPLQPRAEPVDQGGEALVQRRTARVEVLDLGGSRVAGPDQDEDAGAGCRRGLEQRLERVASEQRVRGHRVGAEPLHRPPGSLGAPEQGLGVGAGADRDVAPLAVGQHQQARIAGRLADLGQRRPARGPQPLEAGELGLGGDAGRPGPLDQAPAVRRDRRGGGLGGVERPRRGALRRDGSAASPAGSGSSPRQTWLRRSSTSAASRSANGFAPSLSP